MGKKWVMREGDKDHKREKEEKIWEDESSVPVPQFWDFHQCHQGPALTSVHSGSVGLIGPHDIAFASMVGVIPPMEPAIKITGRGGREEGGVRGLVGWNRHTGVKPLHGACRHSR